MGNGAYCTAQAVDAKNFILRPPYKTAIALSAHCFNKTDHNGNVIGHYGLDEITFFGSYLAGDGGTVNYDITADALWKNPLYHENRTVGDMAIAFSETALPSVVKPFQFLTTSDVDLKAGGIVSIFGHSGDLPYLTSHDCTRIENVEYTQITSFGDMAQGSSGGGGVLSTINSDGDCVLERTVDGAGKLITVNEAVQSGTDTAIHMAVSKSELNTVSYLRPVQQVDDGRCVQAAKITQSSFAYTLPNEHSVRLFSKEYHWRPVQIKTGQDVTYFGSEKDSLGKNWALIKFKDNEQIERHGYMLKNRMLKQQEICFSF